MKQGPVNYCPNRATAMFLRGPLNDNISNEHCGNYKRPSTEALIRVNRYASSAPQSTPGCSRTRRRFAVANTIRWGRPKADLAQDRISEGYPRSLLHLWLLQSRNDCLFILDSSRRTSDCENPRMLRHLQ